MIHVSLIIFSIIHGMNSIENANSIKPTINTSEFKYVTSIWYQGHHYCTGSIIDSRHVITAGHCVIDIKSYELLIYAGAIDHRDLNVKVRGVEKIFTHYALKEVEIPEENSSYWKNDIAILKMDKDLFWSQVLAPIPLSKVEHWHPCEPCTVPLWNAYEIDFLYSINLINVDVRVICDKKSEDCECSPRLNLNEKCVQNLKGEAFAVPGDSGAPVICSDVLSGIITRGYSKNIGSVLLSVYPYLGFITEIIKGGANDVNLGEFSYIVSIWRNNDYICGGTIIDEWKILTAGHCVRGISKNLLRIIAGKTRIFQRDRVKDWLRIDGIKVIYYEGKGRPGDELRGYLRNDVAVLKLTTSLAWSLTIGKSSLPANRNVESGKYCQVFKWIRKHNVKEGISRKLVWFTGQIMPAEKCAQSGIYLGSNQFCVTSPYKFSLSEFDDGGSPLVCEGVVKGIIVGENRASEKILSREAIFIQVPDSLK